MKTKKLFELCQRLGATVKAVYHDGVEFHVVPAGDQTTLAFVRIRKGRATIDGDVTFAELAIKLRDAQILSVSGGDGDSWKRLR